MPQVADRGSDHDGQEAHLLAQTLRWSIWHVLNHDVQVKCALISKALQTPVALQLRV